jgi:hypothetical protein
MKKVELLSTTKLAKGFYFFIILLLASLGSFAQNMGINATGVPPNANAGLDVDFTDKGILIPRVALTGTANFAPLAAHVAGMIVYNTATAGDVIPGFYYNNGTRWVASIPTGTVTGDMLYWNGTAWVRIPAGSPGQFLQFTSSSIPTWTGSAFIDLTTTAATSITSTTATTGGTIINTYGSTILSRGVCYATTPNPTTANSILAGAATSPFTCNLSGLTIATTYYVRAYAVNNSVTSYGNQITFTTLAVLPTISTTAITAVTTNSATGGGNLTNLGGSPNTERGVCYALSPTVPTTANTKIIDPSTGLGSFVSNFTGLNNNTLYNVRAYAINSAGTGYGSTVNFTTKAVVSATAAATAITYNTATSGGTVDVGGAATISARGVCYATTPTPTTANSVVSGGTGTGTFSCNLTGLIGSTTYYVRAYATNAGGTVYGPEISFTTLAPVLPILTTTAITAITTSTATSGGNITDNGGALVTSRGICWSTSPVPTTANTVYVAVPPGGNGAFIGYLTGLNASTYYYVRAYATNSVGTAYGNELNFLTCNTPYYTIGTMTEGGVVFYVDCTGQSGLVAALNDQGANAPYGCSGTVTGATGTAIYSGAANTTAILAACATAGIAARLAASYTGGGFTDWYLPAKDELDQMYINKSVIPNLAGGVNCGYWSSTESSSTLAWINYLCLSSGNVSGALKSFTSQTVVRAIRRWNAPAPVVPTLTTASVTSIGTTTATSGGTITTNGGATVTARGVCWSTISGPTIADPKTTDGAGNGTFISNMTGLTPGSTYYVRAYATNTAGTAYGNEQVFAIGAPPMVTTDPVTNITGTTATSGGNVTSDGGAAVTARGVCWSTATGPTTAGPKTTDGTGTGTFISNLTGLTDGLTYYVRAYATNTNGTSYGNEQTFTASSLGVPTVTTDAPTNGTATSVTSGGNVTLDGGASVTARGVAWSSVNFPPTIADAHTTDGSGTGTFTSSITGLTTGLPYSIVAYATNIYGTGYGAQTYYTPLGAPVVLTYSLNYTAPSTTGTSGVMVTSDGGDPLTAMGIVWDVSPNPTVTTNLGITSEFLGIGYYQTSTITGIVQSTTYYVRAYATNGVGTAYGAEFSFTPGVLAIPTVTTDAVVNLFGAQAECGATVYSDGGDPLLLAGLCWDVSTNPDPTVDINLGSTIDGFTGNFFSIITGLTVGTSYKVRAYATNNTGTAYGAVVTFTATAAYVGQILQGGWLYAAVFNIDGTGTHGTFAEIFPWATTDWGCTSTVTGATGTAFGTGMANTNAITADIAANSCISAYSVDPWYIDFAAPMSQWNSLDWYLPSKDELNEIYLTSATTGLDLSLYTIWSSSEVDATHAWYFDGTTSTWHSDGLKTAGNLVWPIRSF